MLLVMTVEKSRLPIHCLVRPELIVPVDDVGEKELLTQIVLGYVVEYLQNRGIACQSSSFSLSELECLPPDRQRRVGGLIDCLFQEIFLGTVDVLDPLLLPSLAFDSMREVCHQNLNKTPKLLSGLFDFHKQATEVLGRYGVEFRYSHTLISCN